MLGSQIHSYSAYHTNEEPFLPARVHANKIQEVLMGVEALNRKPRKVLACRCVAVHDVGIWSFISRKR